MSKKLVNILKWIWLIVVLAGAGWYFYSHFQEISGYLATLSISRILISAVFLLIGKALLSDITRLSLKKVDWKIPYNEAFSITSITQLGKYLPGGIWHFAGKFGIYKVKGISTRQTTQAMIYENIWLLSSATVIGLLMLLGSSGGVMCGYFDLLCDPRVVTALLIALPFAWLAALYFYERYFFKDKKADLSGFGLVLLEQMAIWALFGVSFWLVFPPHAGFLMPVIGAFSLSWVAGYVAFFAPGGIGIREVLLTVILGGFFASQEVAVYATIHRVLWVLMEIIVGTISAVFIGLPGSNDTPAENSH